MIFFKLLADIKNKKINIAFYIAIYSAAIGALLWRHNMIVTIYLVCFKPSEYIGFDTKKIESFRAL
ncbi:hypothetical protein OFP68_13920 [Brachyspira hyodysenteriae]|uniref:hypothetical protein n=1 Tax=Brachyspira hyodysenteriae TaxID=159 RepID=UPI0022CD6B94|nr:hypothetical protein [Brachyspira hyodysenteriae]MCZ9879969.1 hypothetical protein [Brachyspira hyodysenteriae]